MKRVLLVCALSALGLAGGALAKSVGGAPNGLQVSTKLPGVPTVPQPKTSKVVFQGINIAGSAAGPGGILVGINVGCTGATNWSTNINLARTDGNNASFFHQTVTGKVSGNRGRGSTNYGGAVPANGFIVAASNTFCWSGSDKSMGVGYRDIVFCASSSPKGKCSTSQPASYKP